MSSPGAHAEERHSEEQRMTPHYHIPKRSVNEYVLEKHFEQTFLSITLTFPRWCPANV